MSCADVCALHGFEWSPMDSVCAKYFCRIERQSPLRSRTSNRLRPSCVHCEIRSNMTFWMCVATPNDFVRPTAIGQDSAFASREKRGKIQVWQTPFRSSIISVAGTCVAPHLKYASFSWEFIAIVVSLLSPVTIGFISLREKSEAALRNRPPIRQFHTADSNCNASMKKWHLNA